MNALPPSGPAEVWANLQRLYPIYSELTRELALENDPCIDLEEAVQVPCAEALGSAESWFAATDEKIQIQHLRQFVQTSSKINDAVLRDLLVHNLHKKQLTEHDRDKVDFLLVQIFSEYVPSRFNEADLTLDAAAKLMEPVFLAVEVKDAEPANELESLLQESKQHKTLNSLFTARIIERGRKIKEACGERFFEPLTMIAFARFGFLMRRRFFHLMHEDLNVIMDGLRELESRGLTTIDCRKAQFSAEEPISRLRMICQSWKVMFHAEYSAGQPLCILVDLRTAVESALKNSAVQTKAAAAGAGIPDTDNSDISADATLAAAENME